MSRFFKVHKNRLFFVFLAAIPAYFPRNLNIYADFSLFFSKLLGISMFFIKFATST